VDQTSSREQAQSPSDSAAPSHPLAEAESQSRPRDVDEVSAHQTAAGSSHKAGLSEELLDLFDSIEHLRREVDGLQQPQGLPHASSQQELITDQVLQCWHLNYSGQRLSKMVLTGASCSSHHIKQA